MKTIATLLILFCGITFSNAQEKKLPNKEETKEYLTKMIKDGDEGIISYEGKTDIEWNNLSSDVRYIFQDSFKDTYLRYNAGRIHIECEKLAGGYANGYVKYEESFSGFDFRNLTNVILKSEAVSVATRLWIEVQFKDKNITKEKEYGHLYYGGDYPCTISSPVEKVDKFHLFISNTEGSFDRFKKALFHYKDLLIAEQKQKIADDPFAN